MKPIEWVGWHDLFVLWVCGLALLAFFLFVVAHQQGEVLRKHARECPKYIDIGDASSAAVGMALFLLFSAVLGGCGLFKAMGWRLW